MSKLTIHHRTTPLPVFTYNGGYSDQEEFITTSYHDPKPLTEKLQTNLLNGRKVNHIRWTHLQYDFEISADEITAAIKTFLENFWQANHLYISINTGTPASPVWADYKEVEVPPGVFPLDYLQNLDVLPEIPLNLITILAE